MFQMCIRCLYALLANISSPDKDATTKSSPTTPMHFPAVLVSKSTVDGFPAQPYLSCRRFPIPNPSKFTYLVCAWSGFGKNPSPFFATSFLGSTSTCLLSKRRSSGVMTFFGSASVCLPLFCWLSGEEEDPVIESGRDGAAVDSVKRGAGKLGFLSMASMSRWNLRKRASARMSVDSRSILPESSLTVGTC